MYDSADPVTALGGSFTDIWSRIGAFAPRLVLTLVVLVVGWMIALIVGNIIATVAQAIGLDSLARRIGLTRLLDTAGIEKNISAIVGQLVTWVLVIVVFMAAAEVLGIQSVQIFFNSVLGYIPSVIGAVATLFVGLILANFLSETVRSATQASGLGYAQALTSVTRNAVFVFTVIAVLAQLGIAGDIMRAILYGFIAMVTIAGGLAFGLGGQGVAKKMVDNLESQVKEPKK